MQNRNVFTNELEYDAIYPWHHAISLYCTCPKCHQAKVAKIFSTCAILEAQLATRQSTSELPPSSFIDSTTEVTRRFK